MTVRKNPDQFDPEEAARRRDEVIRRMANTPPQHKETKPKKQTKPKRTALTRKRHRTD